MHVICDRKVQEYEKHESLITTLMIYLRLAQIVWLILKDCRWTYGGFLGVKCIKSNIQFIL